MYWCRWFVLCSPPIEADVLPTVGTRFLLCMSCTDVDPLSVLCSPAIEADVLPTVETKSWLCVMYWCRSFVCPVFPSHWGGCTSTVRTGSLLCVSCTHVDPVSCVPQSLRQLGLDPCCVSCTEVNPLSYLCSPATEADVLPTVLCSPATEADVLPVVGTDPFSWCLVDPLSCVPQSLRFVLCSPVVEVCPVFPSRWGSSCVLQSLRFVLCSPVVEVCPVFPSHWGLSCVPQSLRFVLSSPGDWWLHWLAVSLSGNSHLDSSKPSSTCPPQPPALPVRPISAQKQIYIAIYDYDPVEEGDLELCKVGMGIRSDCVCVCVLGGGVGGLCVSVYVCEWACASVCVWGGGVYVSVCVYLCVSECVCVCVLGGWFCVRVSVGVCVCVCVHVKIILSF